ncbi:DUF3435 domain containing protein [Pyrenophora tritici-repentis]|nr:DUF3435 domain containing protein [Pyrenophora tritici-repentis]
MRRRSLVKGSSDDSDYTRSDTDDGMELDTDLTDVNEFADNNNGNDEDESWLFPNEDHPPECWIYLKKDHYRAYATVSVATLYTFFDWLLSQHQGKGGRKRRGTKLASSLGTYWKVFRLVYERATGVKLDGKMNRSMHKVLRKLAKKHDLKKIGRDKACMYVEDLARVLQTNLATTEKRYPHGRYRIQAQLYLQLGGFTANRPPALLGLCYRHIQVTLLRDPKGGPYRVLLEFTFKFTKEFLGIKDLYERQRRRHALLKYIKERWEFEQLVRDVEQQLAGLENKDDPELVHDVMLPAQGELADSVLSKPGTTIEEEMDRRNRAIRAVTLYCSVEEGGMNPIQRGGRSRNDGPPVKSQLEYEEEALEAAKVSVYKEKRLKYPRRSQQAF